MRALSYGHSGDHITAPATIGCRVNIVVRKVVIHKLRLWRHLVHNNVSYPILDVVVFRLWLGGLGRCARVAPSLG